MEKIDKKKQIVFKNHFSYIFLPVISGLGFIIIISIFWFFLNSNLLNSLKDITNQIKTGTLNEKINMLILIGLTMVPVIVIFILIYRTLVWKNSYLILEENNIYLEYRGKIRHYKKEVPLSHISSVNLNADFMYLLFKIRNVNIDINSSETALVNDYSVTLKKNDAERLKSFINAYTKDISQDIYHKDPNCSDTYNDPDMNDNENPYFEYKFSFNMIIRHIIVSSKIFNIVIFISGIISSLSDKYSLLILSILFIASDIIKNLNTVYGFKIEAYKDTIYISYGLTSTKHFNIPRNKIISISRNQNFFARLFGLECINVDVIGMGNISEENNLLILYLKKDKLNEFAEKINVNIDYIDKDFSSDCNKNFKIEAPSKSKVTFFDKILGFILGKNIYNKPYIRKPINKLYKYFIARNTLITSVFAIVLIIYSNNIYVKIFSIAIALLVSTVLAFYSVHHKNIYISEKNIVLISGIFSKNTEIIPYKKIDFVSKEYNIIQRKMGLSNFRIYMKDHKLGKTFEPTSLYEYDVFDPIIDFYSNGEK